MKVKSLSHVGITVSSFEKAVKWYDDIFGFKLIDEQFMTKEQVNNLSDLYGVKDVSTHLGFLRCPKGGIIEIFEFSKTEKGSKVLWNKTGVTHLTLDAKNIGKYYKELKAKGVKFFSTPQKTGNVEWVFLQDPDGNLIELIDLKGNYFDIRHLGLIVTKVMGGKFKKYYK